MAIDRNDIGTDLVRALIEEQFSDWAGRSIEAVSPQGWDNRTFRLGKTMSVRLPSAACYREQVEKEQLWLPRLAPLLPLPVPRPIAIGKPSKAYPFSWSVCEWLPGETVSIDRPLDLERLAGDAARFLTALHKIDASGGPEAGPHNFFRGGDLSTYDAETRTALEALTGEIDVKAAARVWDAALQTRWEGPGVWLHGDFAPSNLLIGDGRLSAVIDFGNMGIGDPACDLVLAWTLFSGPARERFKEALSLDSDTWARARGWALWKALLILSGQSEQKSSERSVRNVIEAVLGEHDNCPTNPPIRLARAADADGILATHVRSILHLARNAYSEKECESWAAGLVAARYLKAMAKGEIYFVAEDSAGICGFCSYLRNEVIGLYVDPRAARRGLGSQLLSRAETAIARDGRRVIRIEGALSAVSFYKSHGYQHVGNKRRRTRGGLIVEVQLFRKRLQSGKKR